MMLKVIFKLLACWWRSFGVWMRNWTLSTNMQEDRKPLFSAWHTHTWYVRGMWLVRLEITPAHLCLWTNTHTHTQTGECLRFVEPHRRPGPGMFGVVTACQPCVPHAGLSKQTWREGGQGRATATTEPVLPSPAGSRSTLLPHNNRPHGNLSVGSVLNTNSLWLSVIPPSVHLYILNKWLDLRAVTHTHWCTCSTQYNSF